MAHIRKRCLVATVFLACMPASVFAKGVPEARSRLTISVFDDAGVPPESLRQAKKRATSIFAEAGLDLEWLDCKPLSQPLSADSFTTPNRCTAIAYPEHLSVRIVPRALRGAPGTCGRSFLDEAGTGSYVDVFYENVRESVTGSILREGDFLGYVISHEIGHLLLGANSHTLAGVMLARWSLQDLNGAAIRNLFFVQKQGEAMRRRVASPNPRDKEIDNLKVEQSCREGLFCGAAKRL